MQPNKLKKEITTKINSYLFMCIVIHAPFPGHAFSIKVVLQFQLERIYLAHPTSIEATISSPVKIRRQLLFAILLNLELLILEVPVLTTLRTAVRGPKVELKSCISSFGN